MIKKWFQGIIEILVFFPVVLMLSDRAFGENSWILPAVLALSSLVGIVVRKSFLGRVKGVTISFGLVFSFAFAYILTGLYDKGSIGRIIDLILLLIGILMVFIRGVKSLESSWIQIFPMAIFYFGILLNIVALFIFNRMPEYERWILPVSISAVINLLIAIFVISDTQLKTEAVRTEISWLSKSIKKNNRVLLVVSAILIFIFSVWEQILSGIGFVIQWAFRIIMRILLFLSGLLSVSQSGEVKGGPQEMMPLPPAEESAHPIWDIIFNILTVLIIIALAAGLLYFLVKGTIKLWGILQAWIRKIIKNRGLFSETRLGYIDEKESLFKWQPLLKDRLKQPLRLLKQLFSEKDKWENCRNPEQKIRHLYRKLLLNYIRLGESFKPGNTASENIKQINQSRRAGTMDKHSVNVSVERLYNALRYGYPDRSKAEEALFTEEIMVIHKMMTNAK